MAGPFPRRGEIYLAGMRTGAGVRKARPVLILSPDVRNRWAGDVLAIPLSTQIRPGPTHVILDRGEGGLPQSSVVKCEQITCLDKALLEDQSLGQPLSQDRIHQVEDALLLAVGIFR